MKAKTYVSLCSPFLLSLLSLLLSLPKTDIVMLVQADLELYWFSQLRCNFTRGNNFRDFLLLG